MVAPGTSPAERRASGSALRVFFALWPEPAARRAMDELARGVVRRGGGRPPREGSFHLTLAFVGEVARARIGALEAIGEAAARAVAPFTLELDRLGGFHDAGIAWLGTNAESAELAHLVQRLNDGLAARRFRVDRRPFAAHVTLARKCQAPPAGEVVPIRWTVDRLSLVTSELATGGSRYRRLAEWSLRPSP